MSGELSITQQLLQRNRRTHSVHHDEEGAKKAAHDLAYLMGGVPSGYVFALSHRMGAVAFISYRAVP